MLATGGSAVAAIDMMKEKGVKNIKFMCLVAAPEGVEVVNQAHPDVPIYTASLDRQLNEKNTSSRVLAMPATASSGRSKKV